MFIGLHVKYRLLLSEFNKTLQIFKKICSNVNFHENRPSGNGVVSCGRTDRQTDVAKLVAAFRNFANAHHIRLFIAKFIKHIRCYVYSDFNFSLFILVL